MILAKRQALSPLADPFNMFEAFFSDPFSNRNDGVSLQTKVENINNNYVFTLELPGFDEKEIDIQVKNGQIQIIAEHAKETEGKFFHNCVQRTWSLPEQVEPDKVNALLKNGVLTVTVPKKEIIQTKKITIKTEE